MPELPEWAKAGRERWQFDGSTRPAFADAPGLGEESVWDYPRPPKIVTNRRKVTVKYKSRLIANSNQSLRVLETAGGPVFYLPPEHVDTDALRLAALHTRCEWKGVASYWHLMIGDQQLRHVAWCYPDPFPEFAGIQGYFSFYPAKLDCFVDDEQVKPQPGGLYGGWMTGDVKGPVKGDPGSEWW